MLEEYEQENDYPQEEYDREQYVLGDNNGV